MRLGVPPEAGDGAPSVPEQTPATEAAIKGSQVVPHTVIAILHIHHNHLWQQDRAQTTNHKHNQYVCVWR